MIDSGYIIFLLDRLGKQIAELLWLPSLETFIFGFLVWFLLYVKRGISPNLRHFLWVLVLVKPLLSFLLPWPGLIQFPWDIDIHPGHPVVDLSNIGYYVYACVGLVWLVIVALSLIKTVTGIVVMTKRQRRSVPITDPKICRLFDNCRAELGIKRTVSLHVSDEFDSPSLIALGNPVVLVPPWCILELSHIELKHVLLHELAHYARRDHFTVLLVHFCRIFFFFHPTVWYAARRIGIEAERACDVKVIHFGKQPLNYASTLLKVASAKVRTHWHVVLELTQSASLAAVRIRDVLGLSTSHERNNKSSLVILALGIFMAVVPLFQSTVKAPGEMQVELSTSMDNLVNLRQINLGLIPSDQDDVSQRVAISTIKKNTPVNPSPVSEPTLLIDGRPSPRRSMIAIMNKPNKNGTDKVVSTERNQKIHSAILGVSSTFDLNNRAAQVGKKIRSGKIEVQGLGYTGNELFNSNKISLSAGYFVTQTHQLGLMFSIREPTDTEIATKAPFTSISTLGAGLLRGRKIAGFGNLSSLPGQSFKNQEEKKLDQITRIGAFYRYNLPILGKFFTPFLSCGTGLELKREDDNSTIIDAGIGLRYFWAKHVAVLAQAAYRKELDYTSHIRPEISLGISAIF